jgi:hypothetical protein
MASLIERVRQWFAGAQKDPQQSENRKQHIQRRQTIAAFGAYIERDPPGDEIRDVADLPHPKAHILDALIMEIALSEDESEADAMQAAAQTLADFQDDVGPKPVRQFDDALSNVPGRTHEMSEEELLKLATQIVDSPNQDRYAQLRAMADADLIQIKTKLMAADTMRHGMPVEKKRQLRG